MYVSFGQGRVVPYPHPPLQSLRVILNLRHCRTDTQYPGNALRPNRPSNYP